MREASMVIKYKYTVNGKDYFKKITFQSLGKVTIDYPTEVAIYYDSNNPGKSVSELEISRVNKLRSGCLGTVGKAILTLAVVFYVLKIVLSVS